MLATALAGSFLQGFNVPHQQEQAITVAIQAMNDHRHGFEGIAQSCYQICLVPTGSIAAESSRRVEQMISNL